MQTALLYAVTVLIWGTSWLAIKFQLGAVEPLVSVAHRMALAALCCLALTLPRGLARLALRDHARMFVQGLCLFSGNYLLIYAATAELSSGLVAVVFSTLVILNALGGALFLGAPLQGAVVFGGCLGLFGMVGLFLPELTQLGWSGGRLRALGLCFVGTLCASIGNMIAVGSIRRGLPVLTCNSWGMVYGALTLYAVARSWFPACSKITAGRCGPRSAWGWWLRVTGWPCAARVIEPLSNRCVAADNGCRVSASAPASRSVKEK